MKSLKEMRAAGPTSSVRSRAASAKAARNVAAMIIKSMEKREYYAIDAGEDEKEVNGVFLTNLSLFLKKEAEKRRK